MRPRHISIRILILLAAMPAVLFSSCTDNGHDAVKDNMVVLSQDVVQYDDVAQFVSVVSSVDWNISLDYPESSAGWAVVSPETGSGSRDNIILSYSENDGNADRKVALNVSFSDGEVITVTLLQKGNPSVPGEEDPDIEGLITATVSQFLAAEPCDTVWYKLTGNITDISDDTYGNLTLDDGTGNVYIYGLTAEGPLESNDKSFSSIGLKVGDVLTLATVRGEYDGAPQGGGKSTPAYYISHRTSSGDDPDPDDNWPGLVSDPYQSGWLELPAVKSEEGKAFVYHMTEVSGREKRNYSMLYDAQGRIALWVAYPLCSEYMGSGRTDAWGYDPKIPDRYEPVLNHGWPEGGYDRGHQIPSGSRNANTSMNRQTFYYTNMTAQVSRFNQGLWANLENQVRRYSSVCDTLYVVTGPVFDSDDPDERKYTEDNDGNRVVVPDGYFKVLLRYNISSATYYSVAFLYENRDYGRSNPEESDLHSVSEIEQLTGITFFNNLPQNISASVKSQLEPERWGF